MTQKQMLSQDLLKELFDYKGGNLIWKVSIGKRAKVGNIVGSINNYGYIVTTINKKSYLVHRLIYAWHYGIFNSSMQIDHINRDRSDNRIENLRVVTNQQNKFNKTNTKGYTYNKKNKKFQARITINGKEKNLGYFNNEDEAHTAYLNAKEKVHTFDDTPDLSILNPYDTKGYYFNKNIKKFKAYIQVNGKPKHLGYHNTEIEAKQAYLEAKALYNIA